MSKIEKGYIIHLTYYDEFLQKNDERFFISLGTLNMATMKARSTKAYYNTLSDVSRVNCKILRFSDVTTTKVVI